MGEGYGWDDSHMLVFYANSAKRGKKNIEIMDQYPSPIGWGCVSMSGGRGNQGTGRDRDGMWSVCVMGVGCMGGGR